MQQGMTLTSLLLAVALSGIIAVFGGRLIVNQMFMAATAELIDKGDAVMHFYLNALRDREVWRCTMFDTDNENFKKFVLGNRSSVAQVNLRGPNCDWHDWRSHPNLTDAPGFKRGDDLLPKSPAYKYIGDSIAKKTTATNGWWKLKLEVKSGGGKGDVDLELKLCLQETVYTDKHEGQAQVPRSYKYKCPPTTPPNPPGEYMIRRVRYSENAIKKDNCSGKAIISVGDRTTPRIINCSSASLIRINPTAEPPYELDPLRQRTDRQAIKPSTCIGRDNLHNITDRHPVIGTDGSGNLTCATNRVLLHSLGAGTDGDNGASGGSLCGHETVIGKDWWGRPVTYNLDLVVCGINDNGTIRCCSRKGPKGPNGLRGCPASKYYAVKGCEPGNTNWCPTRTTGGVVTCSSRQS